MVSLLSRRHFYLVLPHIFFLAQVIISPDTQ